MADKLEKCMGYVVLPPGHGKSYYHAKFEGIYEADTVWPYNATPELIALRKDAWSTGDWGKYDSLWADGIMSHMPADTIVLMVPAHSVGVLVAQKFIFSAVLSLEAWERNLRFRKGSVAKYLPCYELAKKSGARTYEDNERLETALWQDVIKALVK
jgi:hypothetical protein